MEKEILLFKKNLKFLYKKIDSISNLLWSHDNHITGKRLRSEIDNEDTELKWKNKETTQTGYGEIAMVGININKNKIFSIFRDR